MPSMPMCEHKLNDSLLIEETGHTIRHVYARVSPSVFHEAYSPANAHKRTYREVNLTPNKQANF